MNAKEVYEQSDGGVTKAFYAQLVARGPIGKVAMNLFRAQKSSARAKVYRGGIRGRGSFSSMAYQKKTWSMGQLTDILVNEGASLGITFGWKVDPNEQGPNSWVLYIDLPTQGQVSFHSPDRLAGPVYSGEWDRSHASAERIIAFCDMVLEFCDEVVVDA